MYYIYERAAAELQTHFGYLKTAGAVLQFPAGVPGLSFLPLIVLLKFSVKPGGQLWTLPAEKLYSVVTCTFRFVSG